METIFYLNDNLIEVTGVLDATDESPLVSASSFTFTLLAADGTTITGPIAMTYDAAGLPAALWRGTLEEDVSILPGDEVTADIAADFGSDLLARWQMPLEVKTRTG